LDCDRKKMDDPHEKYVQAIVPKGLVFFWIFRPNPFIKIRKKFADFSDAAHLLDVFPNRKCPILFPLKILAENAEK
jgi:hypothetical protein